MGFDDKLNTKACITENTAKDLITLPYPTMAEEFNNGLNELLTPSSGTWSVIISIVIADLFLVVTNFKKIKCVPAPNTLC